MLKIKIIKQNPFVIFSAIHVISACVILANELLAINNRVPGGNFPFEHKFSWTRVLLFCGVGIISALVVWIFTAKKHLSIFLPSFKLVLLLATFATFVSVLSNYPSVTGWCCEVFPTRYFGFPFSYLSGNSIIEALPFPRAGRIITYQFPYIPYRLLLDILFWSNIAYVILGLSSLLIQKVKGLPWRDRVFIVFVILQALFACWVLLVEIAGQLRWFPMTIFPNEHKDSWAKVILYCIDTVLGVHLVWRFMVKKQLSIYFPSLKSVLLLGNVFTLSSLLFSHYASTWGWAGGASKLVFYFGFPFSFLLGVGGHDYPLVIHFENLNLFGVLANPQLTDFWRIYPYQFFLNFLFWSNSVLVFINALRWFVSGKSNSVEIVSWHAKSEDR